MAALAIQVICTILLAFLHGASPYSRVLAQDQQSGFISIDCGATANYTDSVTGLLYSADGYISTGVVHQISQSLSGTRTDLITLRSFPADSTPTKNCYELPVEVGTQYLLRANIYFGDYTTPPASGILEFQLAVDTTVFTTIKLNTSDTGSYYPAEVLVIATKPNLSLCLVRTIPESAPIISSIELRPLSNKFYLFRFANPTSIILHLLGRRNFGGQRTLIRYPDDLYDRKWTLGGIGWESVNTSQPLTESEFYQWDAPPDVVMQTAATVSATSDTGLDYEFYIDTGRQITSARVYATLFLAEIADLPAGTSRVMNLTSNFVTGDYGQLDLTGSYGSFNTVELGGDANITGGIVKFRLNRDPSSDYDPIVNAFDVYSVLDVAQGTSVKDVTALAALRAAFKFGQWSGDPCFPVAWDEVECTGGNQVTWLNVSGKGLSGTIPSDLSSLSELTYLDLSNNGFTGGFPTWLPELLNLKTLDISNNNLSGTFNADAIPKSQIVRYSGNPQLICTPAGNSLCQSSSGQTVPPSAPSGQTVPPSAPSGSSADKSKSKTSLGPIIGGMVGGILIIVLLTGALTWYCRHKHSANIKIETPPSPGADVALTVTSTSSTTSQATAIRGRAQPYTLQAVRYATTDFNRKLGEGGFGPVYYGVLKNGQQVAVKVMSGKTQQGLSEYTNEIELLSTVHHKRLVSLVGYCQEGAELILLYEYMHGGDLRQRLYDSKVAQEPLSWRQRLMIASDAAKGLEYLHHGCFPAIYHRDVKTSNILLTNKLEAKLADFGLSKLTDEGETHVMTLVKGTLGYLDPEYNTTGMLTDKSDVYSFGVVMLELLCGHPPIVKEGAGGTFIGEKVRVAFANRGLLAVVDPNLRGKLNQESVWKYAEVALRCLTPLKKERPEMADVVGVLTQALQLEALSQYSTSSSGGGGFSSSGALSNQPSGTASSGLSNTFPDNISSAPDEPSQTFYASGPRGR